jgi:hypothetical protein
MRNRWAYDPSRSTSMTRAGLLGLGDLLIDPAR